MLYNHVDFKAILGPAGSGKCLGPGTPVLMYDGTVKAVELIKVGDLLMGDDSSPRKVLETTSGIGERYRITPVKGDSWVCNDRHVLTLAGTNEQMGRVKDVCIETHLAECADAFRRPDRDWKLFRSAVNFQPGEPLPIDPYILGTWIGDGNKAGNAALWHLGTAKKRVKDYIVKHLPAELQTSVTWLGNVNTWKLRANSRVRRKMGGASVQFKWLLNEHGLTDDGKRTISHTFLTANTAERWALLAGLLDTDGSMTTGCIDFACKDNTLCDAVLFLCRSLGLAAYSNVKYVRLEGWTEARPYFRISISGDMTALPSLRIKTRKRGQIKNVLKTGWTAERIEDGAYFGFELDGNGRFLLGDFTVTHNSSKIKAMCLTAEDLAPVEPVNDDVPSSFFTPLSSMPPVDEAQMLLFDPEEPEASTIVQTQTSSTYPQVELKDKKRLLLTATTGVAAFRLGEGCTTINSLFNFYDAVSLQQNLYSDSWLSRIYDKLKNYDGVVVDEVSMMRRDVLDMLVQSFLKLALWRGNDNLPPLSFILSGDFLQIPPVTKQGEYTPYAFLSQWWNQTFAMDTEKLSKIWRQTDPFFQQSLAYARWGMGGDCAASLVHQQTRFLSEPVYGGAFQGFSLYPTNVSVDKHNRICLEKLSSQGRSYVTERWTAYGETEPPELQEIPKSQDFRIGCRIRITDNNHDAGYVNGQLGSLLSVEDNPKLLLDGIDGSAQREITLFPHVRLAYRPVTSNANDQRIISEGRAVANRDYREWKEAKIRKRELPFYDKYKEQIAYAAVQFHPLALGYASTYHRAQGLQFDSLQVDIRNRFAGSPQMVYVALSRCKTSQGLMIVGDPNQLAQRIVTANEVKQFC